MLIDRIAETLANTFDCPCNYDNLAEYMIQSHSPEWFDDHCKPEKEGAAVACWKELFLSMKTRIDKDTYCLRIDKSAYYPRIDKDTYYLNIARAVAQRSTCLHRQYGAVIVNHDEIIATGYNGAPRGEKNCCDVGVCYKDGHDEPRDPLASVHGSQYGSCVAVHAEQNAIISAARKDMQGATLYLASLDRAITPAPCNCCDRMIKNAGIARVVTG